MKRGAKLAFAVSGILFALFFGNVVLGAARLGAFLGDVAEMLVLLGASIAFVISVLMLERGDCKPDSTVSKQGGETR